MSSERSIGVLTPIVHRVSQNKDYVHRYTHQYTGTLLQLRPAKRQHPADWCSQLRRGALLIQAQHPRHITAFPWATSQRLSANILHNRVAQVLYFCGRFAGTGYSTCAACGVLILRGAVKEIEGP